MSQYICVRNWDRLQQYKDRDPKWIKFYRDVLDDYEIEQLPELSQLHLFKIWLLAAKHDNKIPHDPAWIAKKIGCKGKVNINQLVTSGFLSVYDSVQDCTDMYLETEVEREVEIEKKESRSRKTRISADWVLTEKLRDYCKTKRPDLDPEDTAEGFLNFWLADGRTKLDWDRAFMTWVRNERGNKPGKQNNSIPREDSACIAFAAKQNIHPKPGESMWNFRARVEQAMQPGEPK